MNRNLWIIRIVALIALVLSAYIFWSTFSEEAQLAGCGEGSGCDTVLQTKWSSWFGLPVSSGAFIVYGFIFLLTFFLSNDRSFGWLVLLFLALVASGAGIWFMALQSFVIKSYCIYCSMVHLCGIVIAILVFKTIPVQKQEPVKKKKAAAVPSGLPAQKYLYAAACAIAAVLILVAGQMKSSNATITPIPESGKSSNPVASVPTRKVRFLNGAVPIDAGVFPVLGNVEASRMIGHVFDYTCPACRKLHPDLLKAHASSKTALVMIPMPLDAECNPGVPQTSYLHLNACTFAKLGLAIWRAKPEAYAAYDHFMFQNEQPPTAEQAMSVTAQLIGRVAADEALNDEQINHLLRSGVSLFYSQALQRKVLPILLTPEKAVYGIPPASELATLFMEGH